MGRGVFGIFWSIFGALRVSRGLLFCMRPHFQARESINHTVPFRSVALVKNKPFSMGTFGLDTIARCWEITDERTGRSTFSLVGCQ